MGTLTILARANMVDALKRGDKDTKQVYSSIVNALTNKAKELMVDGLNYDQETEVMIKMAKQNQESIDTCPLDREDILSKLYFERDIILKYVPKQLTADEITEIIQDTLSELGIDTPTIKDKGKIMKVLMPKVKGKADGKLVNKLVAELLN